MIACNMQSAYFMCTDRSENISNKNNIGKAAAAAVV